MKIELRWLTSWPGCFPCCCNCWLPRDQHPLARERRAEDAVTIPGVPRGGPFGAGGGMPSRHLLLWLIPGVNEAQPRMKCPGRY